MTAELIKTQIEKIRQHITDNKADWDSRGAQAPDQLIKITLNGSVVTSSNLEGYTDCVPLLYTDFAAITEGPDKNVSAGLKGGGQIEIPSVAFVVDDNATIGATSAGIFNKDLVDIEFVKLHIANDKKTSQLGYSATKCSVLSNVIRHNGYKFFILMLQNVEFKENEYGEDGVKKGVSAAGKFDAASGQ